MWVSTDLGEGVVSVSADWTVVKLDVLSRRCRYCHGRRCHHMRISNHVWIVVVILIVSLFADWTAQEPCVVSLLHPHGRPCHGDRC